MITEKQRIERMKCIGSSDAAGIMGADPHNTIANVWLEKTGKVESFAGNEATEWGNDFEPLLLNRAERELGVKLERDVHIVHPKHKELAANLDGLKRDTLSVVEAKSSRVVDEWGNEADAIPKRAIVQCHFQMACLGAASTIAYVPRILPGFKNWDWKLHVIQRDNELCEMIVEGCLQFWFEHVVKDIRPDHFRPSIEVVKRMKRLPNKTIDLPVEAVGLLAAMEDLATQRKKLEKQEESEKARMIAYLQDAEAGVLSDGRLVTFLEQERAGYTVKPTKFRQLKIKKA